MLVRVQAIAKGIPGCTPYFDSCDTIISNGLDMSVICIYLILIYKKSDSDSNWCHCLRSLIFC